MDIMNLKELTQYLKISESMVRKLVREKNIKFFRIGNRLYFRKSDIDEYIENQCIKNNEENEYIVKEASIKQSI